MRFSKRQIEACEHDQKHEIKKRRLRSYIENSKKLKLEITRQRNEDFSVDCELWSNFFANQLHIDFLKGDATATKEYFGVDLEKTDQMGNPWEEES